jgi:hypothetical protein
MFSFGNPVVAGTTLVRPAIKSPNYAAGSTGWSVNQDGSAEFNNLTLRGQYFGTDYTFDSAGAFWFDPATGHLIAAIAAGSGSSFGEPYTAGVGAYYTSPGGVIYAVNMFPGGGFVPINFLFNSGAGFQTSAQIASINATGLNIDSSFSGDLTLNAGAHNIILDSPVQATSAITAQGGTAAAPTVITTDFFATVTPPANTSGTLRIKLMPDKTVMVEVQLTIAAAAAAGTLTLIGSLGAAYKPTVQQRDSVGFVANGSPTLAQLQAMCGMRWQANTSGSFNVLGFVGGASGSGVVELSFVARYSLD